MEAFIAFLLILNSLMGYDAPDFSDECDRPYICRTSEQGSSECLKESVMYQMKQCVGRGTSR